MRADEAIIEKLLECEIPVIVVLCKLLSMNDTTGLKEVIMKRFEYVSGVIVLNIVNYNTYTLKPFNLENLVILTNEVLDEGMRNAFIASQKIDLRFKKERAVKTVIASSSNSKIKSIKDLPNVCIDMITEITGIFGLELKNDNINIIISTFFLELKRIRNHLSKIFF